MTHPHTPRTSRTDYWRLDGAAGDIPLDYLPTTTRAPTLGDSMDIGAIVSGYSDPLDDPDAETWPVWEERYYALLDTYGPHAGAFTIHELGGSAIAYTETHGSESLLVALRPPEGVAEREGSWSLVETCENETLLRGRAKLSLSLVHLARLDKYSTADELRQRLAQDPI